MWRKSFVALLSGVLLVVVERFLLSTNRERKGIRARKGMDVLVAESEVRQKIGRAREKVLLWISESLVLAPIQIEVRSIPVPGNGSQ
jgi:hypothetical protein